MLKNIIPLHTQINFIVNYKQGGKINSKIPSQWRYNSCGFSVLVAWSLLNNHHHLILYQSIHLFISLNKIKRSSTICNIFLGFFVLRSEQNTDKGQGLCFKTTLKLL